MKLTAKVEIIQAEGVFLVIETGAFSGKIHVIARKLTKGQVDISGIGPVSHGDVVQVTFGRIEQP